MIIKVGLLQNLIDLIIKSNSLPLLNKSNRYARFMSAQCGQQSAPYPLKVGRQEMYGTTCVKGLLWESTRLRRFRDIDSSLGTVFSRVSDISVPRTSDVFHLQAAPSKRDTDADNDIFITYHISNVNNLKMVSV